MKNGRSRRVAAVPPCRWQSRRAVIGGRRLRRAHQAAAEPARRRDERGRLLPRRAGRVQTRLAARCSGGRRHRARRRRRGGAESGVRARHRRADATDAHASAAGRPRRRRGDARVFGLALAGSASRWLALAANLARRASRAARRSAIYLVVYTPMKRRSSAATLVGAVPGALPPLIGWTAAHGTASARRLGALRDRVPLADSALHGDRVDVPRRLPAGRFPDAAGDRAGRPAHRAAGGDLRRGAGAGEPGADVGRRRRLASTSAIALVLGVALLALCRPLRRQAIRRARRGAVLRLDHLPAAHLDWR